MSERWRQYLIPALLGLAIFAVAAAAGYVTANSGDNGTPAADVAIQPNGTRGSIQSVNGNDLTLRTEVGPREFTLRDDVAIEALTATNASTITIGGWLNAGAIPHTQTRFVIVGLNLIPPQLVEDR